MISSTYNFQLHLQHSQRCFSQPVVLKFVVLPDFSPALRGFSSALPDLSAALPDLLSGLPELLSMLPDLSSGLPDMSSALPDMSLGLPDMSSGLSDLLSALPGAPRCSQSSLRRSEVFPNLSQSLPWYSCTSHHRSQLLRRPARPPSHSLILS
jgi:hypothetical protein